MDAKKSPVGVATIIMDANKNFSTTLVWMGGPDTSISFLSESVMVSWMSTASRHGLSEGLRAQLPVQLICIPVPERIFIFSRCRVLATSSTRTEQIG
jgi:hypothetical protein